MRSVGWLALIASGLVLLLSGPAQAGGTIEVALDFAAPSLQETGGGTELHSPDCTPLGRPGAPLLPAREAVVLLPPGEEITSVRIATEAGGILANIAPLRHAQTPRPISLGPGAPTAASAAIYGSSESYPSEAAELVTVQRAWGHRLAFFRVTPFAYRPAEGELAWFSRVTLEVETAPAASGELAGALLRRDPHVLQRIGEMVLNPADLSRYEQIDVQRVGQQRIEPGDYPYVIVTTDAFADAFEPLAALQSSRGLHARIMTLGEIDALYSDDDQQMRIRSFITDAYETWGTLYVLLGGDYDVVPIRPLYVNAGGTVDQFPGDCYYEGLDGTWNDDNDNLWGEHGEYDLIGEVAVGRASISNTTELSRWMHKNELYTEAPVAGEVKKALFIGESLDSNTWGGDSMDEVKDYAATHGYTTSGYPGDYTKQTLYERSGNWSKYDVIDLFNAGHASSHHLGHSNTTYNMKMENPDVALMTADGVTHTYCFISSQGCISNNFDNPSTDSISEAFLYHEYGASAYLGNTRYGWYSPGSTGGPSQHFDRQFVDALYNEGIHTVGWMNVDSKTDCIWMLDDWMLWCHYELCLLGDPAMPQWVDVHGTLTVEHSGTYLMGTGVYEVTVRSAGTPVAGATVTIYGDDPAIWATATTGADGVAVLDPGEPQPSTLTLKAVKADYLAVTDQVDVIPPSGPFLVYHDVAVHDDGNQNGLLDYGETAGLAVFLENVGVEAATGVSGTLTSSDPYTTITLATGAYPDIPAGGIAANLEDYLIGVGVNVPDQHVIGFDIQATGAEGVWDGGFHVTAQAPVLGAGSQVINDWGGAGDGDGVAEPGELIVLGLWLLNDGHADAGALTAQLTCDSPGITLYDDAGEVDPIETGGATLCGSFEFAVSPTCPDPASIPFTLQLSGAGGFAAAVDFELTIGAWFDDAEADRGWTLGLPDDDATTGIWERAEPVGTIYEGHQLQPEYDHTPDPAEACFVTQNGPAGGSAGEADVDGGRTTLLTPVFDLSNAVSATIGYWRWYTNSWGGSPDNDWWDVDVTADGETWISLEHTMTTANEWNYFEFNLEEYIPLTDHVQIRFIAADEGDGSLVEAAVDDFSLSAMRQYFQDTPAEEQRLQTGFISFGRNPSQGSRRIVFQTARPTHVKLELYDISGRRLRSLVNEQVTAGSHPVTFDGRDDTGRPVASGVYYLRLETPEMLQVRQMTVLR